MFDGQTHIAAESMAKFDGQTHSGHVESMTNLIIWRAPIIFHA